MVNKLIAKSLTFMPKKIIYLFSRKYIAGNTLTSALTVAKNFNKRGITTTIDLLGESNTDELIIEKNLAAYKEIIRETVKNKIETTYSVKPTMFGLQKKFEDCYTKIRLIVEQAHLNKKMVRIDMEDSSYTDAEIELYLKLRKEFPANVGIVLQSYLRRTHNDILHLSGYNTDENPINVRICKGIYREPFSIAYKKNKEIHEHFLQDLELMFHKNFYIGIATHHTYLINESEKIIKKLKIDKSRFEFQMLYGVRPKIRNQLVEKGYPMRIYVPFGEDWLKYSIRRLEENPRIINHIIKSVLIPGR